jgi:hypothetical protein
VPSFFKISIISLLLTYSLMAESIEQPNHASLYVGKYADANLLTIIPKIFTANLEMKDVSISSIAYFRDLYSFTAFECKKRSKSDTYDTSVRTPMTV